MKGIVAPPFRQQKTHTRTSSLEKPKAYAQEAYINQTDDGQLQVQKPTMAFPVCLGVDELPFLFPYH